MSSKTDYQLSVRRPSGEPLEPDRATAILIKDVLDSDGFAGLREGLDETFGWLSGWDKRWEPDDDMLPLSKKHPDVVFTLWGRNEDDDGPFTTYYLGGRLQHELAEVRIAPFDPFKLR